MLYSEGKKPKILFVHRIVLSAFVPNTLNKPVVNHIDGNKKNNCVENLEWATHSENNKHAYKTCLRTPITKKGNLNKTKYTKDQILDVKRMISNGSSTSEILKATSYSKSSIHRIKSNKTWTNINL